MTSGDTKLNKYYVEVYKDVIGLQKHFWYTVPEFHLAILAKLRKDMLRGYQDEYMWRERAGPDKFDAILNEIAIEYLGVKYTDQENATNYVKDICKTKFRQFWGFLRFDILHDKRWRIFK